MGKIVGKIISILSLFLLAVFLSFQTPAALAQADPKDTCKGVRFAEYTTNTPLPILTDNYNKARFIIDIGNVGGFLPGYNYKMEFRCGAQSFTGKQGATPITGTMEIFNDLDKSSWFVLPGTRACEFSREPHEIWVTAEKNNKSYPVCRITYEVVDADTLCKLTLNPADKIIAGQNLKISGEKLGQGKIVNIFGLFLDSRNVQRYASPSFSDFLIPDPDILLAKLGRHRVDIRRDRNSDPKNPPDYGPVLCPVDFTVGTPENPGKVLDETDIKQCKGGPNCSSGTTSGCDIDPNTPGIQTDPNHPSVKTAIGCIHTNPADLMQDVLKFGVGIGGGVAFLMMLLGAFQMLTSAGNPETLQAGRDRLTSAVIGLLIIIFSVLLLQIIGVDILEILKR